ncbi:PilN domain-containing protein [Candidatus Microgenomates bacterium]|nr:PilN domain-containing protein [Candidatus Microgenomates bacterium]
MNPLKLKINLLSKKDLEEKALGRFLKWSLSFGRYIIVGTEIIVLIAFFSRFKLDRQLTDLHEAINQKEVIVQFNLDFENKSRNIQQQLAEIKNIEKDYNLSLQLLNFLEKNLPKDIAFKTLTLSQGKISLAGTSLSNSSFIDFLARIRASEKFSQVILQDLSRKGEEELEFKLSAEINKDKLLTDKNETADQL